MGDRTSSHCSRSNIPNEKSVVRGLSGCLSKIATHPVDSKLACEISRSGRSTSGFMRVLLAARRSASHG